MEYSGRLSLRIPRTLHARIAEEAEREGVSINQFISSTLAARVDWRAPHSTSVIYDMFERLGRLPTGEEMVEILYAAADEGDPMAIRTIGALGLRPRDDQKEA